MRRALVVADDPDDVGPVGLRLATRVRSVDGALPTGGAPTLTVGSVGRRPAAPF